jgi:ABC-2 type transport system ATP-binding protein
MSTKEPAIQIENLSYFYKSHWCWKKFQGLKDLSLTIAEGESFGFLGHNGAGKTTAIKCMLGLTRPASGSIKIFGQDSRTLASRSAVGYVPEQPYFYDHLTVNEIMRLYAALAGVPRPKINPAVEEALARIRLESKARVRMRSLSRGLMQRVAVAQAIVAKPRLLILDEPFSGLDPIGRKELADLLFNLKRAGTTIFMSSHILSDVEFLCERVSIMSHGQLKGVFALKDVPSLISGHYELVIRDFKSVEQELTAMSQEAAAQDVFLRLVFRDKARAEQALARAIQAGAGVESFQFVHGGLEELFVRLVKFEEAGKGR